MANIATGFRDLRRSLPWGERSGHNRFPAWPLEAGVKKSLRRSTTTASPAKTRFLGSQSLPIAEGEPGYFSFLFIILSLLKRGEIGESGAALVPQAFPTN